MRSRQAKARRLSNRLGRRSRDGPARSTALFPAPAVDALRRPGERFESGLADGPATVRASAERPLVDTTQGGVDLTQHVPGVVLECVVELAVERRRGRVGHVVVISAPRAQLTGLVLERAGVLVVEVLDRRDHARALIEEALTEA